MPGLPVSSARDSTEKLLRSASTAAQDFITKSLGADTHGDRAGYASAAHEMTQIVALTSSALVNVAHAQAHEDDSSDDFD